MTISHAGNESEDLLGNFQYKPSAPAKHDHVILDMQAGARISFNDARRFGAMDLIDTKNLFDQIDFLYQSSPLPQIDGRH